MWAYRQAENANVAEAYRLWKVFLGESQAVNQQQPLTLSALYLLDAPAPGEAPGNVLIEPAAGSAAIMSIIGFGVLLFTFLGVNFLLTGHHGEFTTF